MKTEAEILSRELGQNIDYIQNVITLLDGGNTIPFIARYRKEQHGMMDDSTLRKLETRLHALRTLQERREEVKRGIDSQGKLTPELSAAIDSAATLTEVEDLYRPFKQKRRTRASAAREKGLEPLAELLFAQDGRKPEKLAAPFVNPEKGVDTVEEALAGASDILAEKLSDDAAIRKTLRELVLRRGNLEVKAADAEHDSVYRLYYAFSQSVSRIQDHQILAINRGEKEELLKVNLTLPGNEGTAAVIRAAAKPGKPISEFVRSAAEDAFSRLIFPSVQREIRAELTQRAGEGAIRNFAWNLKPLLLQPPIKGCVTMGLDPGYRNGCKVAVVDSTGKVLDTTVVYPTFSAKKKEEAISVLSGLMKKHSVRCLAIGNGTASRETEAMAIELLHGFPDAGYVMVNEAGASVYSASELASLEFPEYDVNLRSAISIARRLQDPLAELVKIDPKAIGVGQYQHDCPQKELDTALAGVVEDCVNAVGVDVNTASWSLLQRVSGLTSATAKNIVAYREANGPFTQRTQLKKVSKLGPKTYEQCIGFLRVPESKEPLDNTGIHPESYPAAKALLKLLNGADRASLPGMLQQYGPEAAAEKCGVGVPTLTDIAKELAKPGRDPREELPAPILRKDVLDVKDLKPGMRLSGTVRNVIDFGVFVDIGVHQDGLVHISEVADRRLRHPSEAVQVGEIVDVIVLDVDEKRRRISLSMKQAKQK